ncbi:AMP-binding protein [Massilia sp. H-1]|nr:AMP-binding protein [Massilia sp. H-1]
MFGAERLSYAELNQRANRLAHHLRTLGVGKDVRVAVCVERSVEMVVGLLAILKAMAPTSRSIRPIRPSGSPTCWPTARRWRC